MVKVTKPIDMKEPFPIFAAGGYAMTAVVIERKA